MVRRVTVALVALLLGLGGAAPALATDPGTVNLLGCAFGGGTPVPAGTAVTLRFAFGTDTLGEATTFLKSSSVAAGIDGVNIANAKSYFSAPARNPMAPGWTVAWTYPTGRELAAGDAMTASFDVVLSHSVPVGTSSATGHQLVLRPGSIFGGPITCVIGAI
jgi:hypothetical protein